MTVLPTVRRQLLLAADRQATNPEPNVPRERPWRVHLPRAGTLLAALSVAVAVGVAVVAVALLHGANARRSAVSSAPRSTVRLLGRPLHLPSLAPDGRCPASPGHAVHNLYFTGMALGTGPVRVLLADRGDIRHGRVEIGENRRSLHGIQTLWFALPSYRGPFAVRGARLGTSGRIEVRPSRNGQGPGSGPLLVRAGPTANTYPNGDRTVPGSTWVASSGCYAWQIDGRGFSEVIVFDALGPGHGGS
jgi:hypothetical protein